MSKIEAFSDNGVKGFLHVPDRVRDGNLRRGLVLTHGAGGNAQAPLLVRVASAFADAGLSVLRCDMAFRLLRPNGPPHPSQSASDRAGLKVAVEALAATGIDRVALGGHSYGGRQASMLAAEEPALVPALLLLSYPLHPPNRPEQLRTGHFPSLRTPALFVSGTRDAFGTPEELRTATAAIPGHVEAIFAEGAGHDLSPKWLDIESLVVPPFLRLF